MLDSVKYDYNELSEYIGMKKLPKDFEKAYDEYEPSESKVLIERDKLESFLAPYELSEEKHSYIINALDAIESNTELLHFSQFFVWDMCSVRNKYDLDNYSELMPNCIGEYNEAYAFLVLLACVPVAEKEMLRRGIPYEYYADIPHRMLREQLGRYKETGRIDVEDMPWKLNFYTLAIFLFDRFLFIPYIHGDKFELYRNKKTGSVTGIYDGDCLFDNEGQLIEEEESDDDKSSDEAETDSDTGSEAGDLPEITGTGYEYARAKAKSSYTYRTVLKETKELISGFRMNPMGYTENEIIALNKSEYKKALAKDDWLLALHIPAGEGYTPERVRNSMKLALEFYTKYYPELTIKGFWSESWLYDPRLSLLLSEDKNIVQVQRQFFNYSGGWDGEMLYIHLFKDMKNKLDSYECRTSLQKAAKEFLLKGGRFCSTGMIFLNEELENGNTYITEKDIEAFNKKAEIK